MATNTNARFRRALVPMDRDIRSGSMAFRLPPNRSAAYPMPSSPIRPMGQVRSRRRASALQAEG